MTINNLGIRIFLQTTLYNYFNNFGRIPISEWRQATNNQITYKEWL